MIKVVCLESGDFSTMIKNENNIPAGYKDSAVGIIPQEWEVKTLINLGDFLKTNTLSRDKMNDIKGNVHNIHYGDVLIKYPEILDINKRDIPWINEDYNIRLGDYLANGDVIISDTAEDYTVGKATEIIGVSDEKVVAGLHTMAYRPYSSRFASCFLGYYINSSFYRKQLFSQIQGIKVCSISKSGFSNTSVCIPSILEQQKIVEILRTWDEAIEKQTKLIKALEKRKQALMQRLLSGRTRLPGFTGEWKHIRIENIANEYSIRNHEQSNLTVLSCTKYNGLVSSLDYFGKQIYSNDLSSYKLVPKNHFAYATNHIDEGSIGYQSDYDEALISPMYTVFRTNNKIVNDNYMCMLLKTDYMIYKYKSLMEGSIDRRGGLHWKSFASIEVKLPLLEEQIAIANILVSADDEIKRHNTKLSQLRKQKRGLMQQLLTGKKRVK